MERMGHMFPTWSAPSLFPFLFVDRRSWIERTAAIRNVSNADEGREERKGKKREKCIEIENSCDWSSCWRRGLKSPYIMRATSIRSSSSQMIWALELSDIFFCQSSFTFPDPSCFVAPLCFWSLIPACSESHKKIEETTNIYTSSIAETSGWSITQQRLNQGIKVLKKSSSHGQHLFKSSWRSSPLICRGFLNTSSVCFVDIIVSTTPAAASRLPFVGSSSQFWSDSRTVLFFLPLRSHESCHCIFVNSRTTSGCHISRRCRNGRIGTILLRYFFHHSIFLK